VYDVVHPCECCALQVSAGADVERHDDGRRLHAVFPLPPGHQAAGGENMRANTEAILIKHLWEKLHLRENFGTELQQNQRTVQILIIMVGGRSNSK